MPNGGEIHDDINGTVRRLHEQLDTAIVRSVELHRTGAHDEAALAETAVAVGAAKALEILTGESWEAQLERREDWASAATQSSDRPAVESKRRLRRKKPDPQ